MFLKWNMLNNVICHAFTNSSVADVLVPPSFLKLAKITKLNPSKMYDYQIARKSLNSGEKPSGNVGTGLLPIFWNKSNKLKFDLPQPKPLL